MISAGARRNIEEKGKDPTDAVGTVWRGSLQVVKFPRDCKILTSSRHSLRLALAQSFRNMTLAHEVLRSTPDMLAGSLDPPC